MGTEIKEILVVISAFFVFFLFSFLNMWLICKFVTGWQGNAGEIGAGFAIVFGLFETFLVFWLLAKVKVIIVCD